jgi:hypothetical protein|tara:strand:- start:244 stop:753 length:510 start_codon:yes stop_codon:yes gene_type:complete
MKILLLYIKKINILTFLMLFILIPSQTKSESLSIFTETPIIVNPESEYEGFLIDLILDKMVYHYYKIPSDGVKKHNSTLFLSISNPSHGKIYSWKSGKFYGLIRMISSKKEKKKICRIWLEEIGKFTIVDNYGKNSYEKVTSKIASNKACFDLDEGRWVMVDENYHFNN